MPGSPKTKVDESADNSANGQGRKVRAKVLAGIAVLGLAVLLLIWGLYGTQWTVLSTNTNLADAVAIGTLNGSETHLYSIPQGQEWDISVGLSFKPSSGGYSASGGINGTFYYNLATPVSTPTTTSQYYAYFSLTNPNGSAVNVWFTGPQGNLTQDCGSGVLEIACFYSPTPNGIGVGPRSNFFQAPTAGNYTMHLLSSPCSAMYDYCTSTTAIVSVTRSLSSVIYSKPYYNAGLATAIVAGVAIVAASAFLSIIGNRVLNKRVKTHPVGVSTPSVAD